MVVLQDNNLIGEKLRGQYEDFLRYCEESGKKFVDELDKEDFIAYRVGYSVEREQIEKIKNLLDFQEQKIVEENSAPQNISDELEDSLQKYFNVKDRSPYENILITDLDFNVRVQNCLSSNVYRTLAELLKSSQQILSSFRNFGKGSFDNLLATLKNFFDSSQKKIIAKSLQLSTEDLDEFLCEAALSHDPQIDLIIAAFEKFSASVTIKNLFRDLSDQIKNKRAYSFVLACDLEHDEFFDMLPEKLTIAELPEYLAENLIDLDVDKLKNFANELRFDVRAYAQEIIPALFKNERELEIIFRRAEGATLEEAGKIFALTRERVRQIELKVIARFEKRRAVLKKFFHFIHALADEKLLVTPDDLKKFMDADDVKIIYFLAAKVDLKSDSFHFDKELNAFIFADEIALDENELIKNLPDVMEEEIFEETIINLAREKNYPVELERVGKV